MGTKESEVKWTRGPHSVSDMNEVVSSNGGDLADCWSALAGIDEDEAKANAYLFAAAPDLYEALDALVNVVSDLNLDPSGHTIHAVNAADIALAKARGE